MCNISRLLVRQKSLGCLMNHHALNLRWSFMQITWLSNNIWFGEYSLWLSFVLFNYSSQTLCPLKRYSIRRSTSWMTIDYFIEKMPIDFKSIYFINNINYSYMFERLAKNKYMIRKMYDEGEKFCSICSAERIGNGILI